MEFTNDECYRETFRLENRKKLMDNLTENLSEYHSIDLGVHYLGNKKIKPFVNELAINTSLVHLKLNENRIRNLGIVYLARALTANTTLKHLNLRDNRFRKTGVLAIAKMLTCNSSLTFLNMGFNRFHLDRQTMKTFGYRLGQNKGLQTLILDNTFNNNNTIDGFEYLAHALKIHSSLTHVNLNYNDLKVSGAQLVSEMILKNHCITHLELTGNSIRDEGAIMIASALSKSSLRYLNLSANRIQCEGAQAIAEALGSNSCLLNLEIRCNLFETRGAKAMAKMIETNTCLMHLDISYNRIETEALQAIRQAYENSNLHCLNVMDENNFYSEDSKMELKKVMKITRNNNAKLISCLYKIPTLLYLFEKEVDSQEYLFAIFSRCLKS